MYQKVDATGKWPEQWELEDARTRPVAPTDTDDAYKSSAADAGSNLGQFILIAPNVDDARTITLVRSLWLPYSISQCDSSLC